MQDHSLWCKCGKNDILCKTAMLAVNTKAHVWHKVSKWPSSDRLVRFKNDLSIHIFFQLTIGVFVIHYHTKMGHYFHQPPRWVRCWCHLCHLSSRIRFIYSVFSLRASQEIEALHHKTASNGVTLCVCVCVYNAWPLFKRCAERWTRCKQTSLVDTSKLRVICSAVQRLQIMCLIISSVIATHHMTPAAHSAAGRESLYLLPKVPLSAVKRLFLKTWARTQDSSGLR